eukprot:CAMPEP_0119359048 /NCGR_PEP_ID=MMETSP1334-20130426/7043_1 /TAXON_ID=127549 /ORGANISM="Calcidiscus leptoporus, Strain RCC1130" /LENGTH=61 /DNA_ID=CAMNT_0007373643 /DNA_START=710 /DNA_END=891 /DNA_ORIENTATION=-
MHGAMPHLRRYPNQDRAEMARDRRCGPVSAASRSREVLRQRSTHAPNRAVASKSSMDEEST